MILRLRTKHFRFAYTFESGHKLVGTIVGDVYANQPDFAFNLRSLTALCLSPEGSLMMGFDDVFGQFEVGHAKVLFSGSHSTDASFFSFNYRDGEACIYDAVNELWITTNWNPQNWHVEELANQPLAKPPLPWLDQPLWTMQAIA